MGQIIRRCNKHYSKEFRYYTLGCDNLFPGQTKIHDSINSQP